MALRHLVRVLTKSLSIIYEHSGLLEEVPVDWKLSDVMNMHKKGQKKDPGKYRPVNMTLKPEKVMDQIILNAIMRYNQVFRSSQHLFMKGKPCLTSLISFYDKVTHLVYEGKAVDIFFLDFS